jgi:hypothetical protein
LILLSALYFYYSLLIKKLEIHQKALSGLEQKIKLTQEKTAQAETAAQVQIRELDARLVRQLEHDAQNKANIDIGS